MLVSPLVRSVDGVLHENRWVSEGTVHTRKLDSAFQISVKKKTAIHLEDCVASTSHTEQFETGTTDVMLNRLARRAQTWCSFHKQAVLQRPTERHS